MHTAIGQLAGQVAAAGAHCIASKSALMNARDIDLLTSRGDVSRYSSKLSGLYLFGSFFEPPLGPTFAHRQTNKNS